LKEKVRIVALNHYLEKKKALDDELEKEMRILNKKYEKLAEPIFEKVNLILFLIIDKNIQIFLYLLK
jgi:nucleosome assembly protein 1-like 1